MADIKLGYGIGIKATLLTPAGAVCDLRDALYVNAVLTLPNGSTMYAQDIAVDRVTNAIYVRLLADRELTAEGNYRILFNVKLADGVMYSTVAVNFANVTTDTNADYKELSLSFSLEVTDYPQNVERTGASPKVSPRQTWLVYNDEAKAYEDTGVPAEVNFGDYYTKVETDEKVAELESEVGIYKVDISEQGGILSPVHLESGDTYTLIISNFVLKGSTTGVVLMLAESVEKRVVVTTVTGDTTLKITIPKDLYCNYLWFNPIGTGGYSFTYEIELGLLKEVSDLESKVSDLESGVFPSTLHIPSSVSYDNKYGTISQGLFMRFDIQGNSVVSYDVSSLIGQTIQITTKRIESSELKVAYIFTNINEVEISLYETELVDVGQSVIVPTNAKWLHINYDSNYGASVSIPTKVNLVTNVLSSLRGNGEDLSAIFNVGITDLSGEFTLNSALYLADNQCLKGHNCTIIVGESAQIVLGQHSYVDGITFRGDWNPIREHGDGVYYTQYGYKPIKYVHTGESSEDYLSSEDLDNGSAPCFGINKEANDAVIRILAEKSCNASVRNCVFQYINRTAIYASAERHEECNNPVIFGNYFDRCWTGLLMTGEFIRVFGNCYTSCVFGSVWYGTNINLYGEIYKCCDIGLYITSRGAGHSEINAIQIAHCGIATIYMRGIRKDLGLQIIGSHLVDGYVGGYDNNNVLISNCRLDVWFRLLESANGKSLGNSIICSNVGKSYLYGNPLFNVPSDTMITLNRGMSNIPDSEVNNNLEPNSVSK